MTNDVRGIIIDRIRFVERATLDSPTRRQMSTAFCSESNRRGRTAFAHVRLFHSRMMLRERSPSFLSSPEEDVHVGFAILSSFDSSLPPRPISDSNVGTRESRLSERYRAASLTAIRSNQLLPLYPAAHRISIISRVRDRTATPGVQRKIMERHSRLPERFAVFRETERLRSRLARSLVHPAESSRR